MNKDEWFKNVTFPWIFKQIPNAIYIDDGNESRKFVPERTCRNVCDWRDEKGVLHSDARLFKCSECGYKADDFYGDDEENFPRYCFNCGAKVVEE